jgi:hypothetical protein
MATARAGGALTLVLAAVAMVLSGGGWQRLQAAVPLGRGSAARAAQAAPLHTFTIADDRFLLDGQPFRVLSGSVHYHRITPDQWAERLARVAAMGLNAIQVGAAAAARARGVQRRATMRAPTA